MVYIEWDYLSRTANAVVLPALLIGKMFPYIHQACVIGVNLHHNCHFQQVRLGLELGD